LLAISCIELAAFVSFFLLVSLCAFVFAAMFKNTALLALGIPLAIAFCVLGAWLFSWIMLALMHAIRGIAEQITIGEAFHRALPRAWSFVWLGIVTGFASLGGLVLFAAIPGGVFALGIGLLAGSSVGAIFGVIAAVIGAVVSLLLFGAWFSQAQWLLVDADTRGVTALLTSKRLVGIHFWPLMWRVCGTALLVGVAAGITSALGHAVSLLLPSAWQSLGSTILTQIIGLLVFTPVTLGAFYSLYKAIRAQNRSVDVSKGRGGIIALSIVGLVGIIVLPIVAALIGITVFMSANAGTAAAAARQAEINALVAQSVSGATASSSPAAPSSGAPTLTVSSESQLSIIVSFTNMPPASVSVVSGASGAVVWQEQLGSGNDMHVIMPTPGVLTPGSYHLEAKDAAGTVLARSASFAIY